MTRLLDTSEDWRADYGYDKTGQLIAAVYTGDHPLPSVNEEYTFDENGNRTLDGYETGANNQLESDGTYNYEHDAEGNRTEKRLIAGDVLVERYTWDHRNRLIAVHQFDEQGDPVQTIHYAYDAFDRKVARSVDEGSDDDIDSSELYLYDGADVIVDYVDADGEGVGDPTIARRYLHGPIVDQILAQEDATTGDVDWFLADHLQSTRELVRRDGTTGDISILDEFEYDAFGNLLDGDEDLTRYLFTARERDADTGLQYNRARWYDAAVGIFVSEDPIGFEGGDANLNRYVGNDPLNITDPHGLVWQWVSDAWSYTKAIAGGAWQGVKNLGNAIYGAGKTVVGTATAVVGEVVGIVPAAYEGVNNLAGGESDAYWVWRAGLNNIWEDVSASAWDIIKPWNPYEASNPQSSNDVRMEENVESMEAGGTSGVVITIVNGADIVGNVATNLVAGCYVIKGLAALPALQPGATASELLNRQRMLRAMLERFRETENWDEAAKTARTLEQVELEIATRFPSLIR